MDAERDDRVMMMLGDADRYVISSKLAGQGRAVILRLLDSHELYKAPDGGPWTDRKLKTRIAELQTMIAPPSTRRVRTSVTTWANGFGIWHVRVSRTAASPLVAARRALRDELQVHEAPHEVARKIYMKPVRVPELDTEDTIVYREGDLV